MPSFHVSNTADARRLPWAGGAGSSLQLARWPIGSSPERGDLELELSLERVEGDGPYPSRAGFEHMVFPFRTQERSGTLDLSHGESASPVHLRPGEAARFRGDWTTRMCAPAGAVELVTTTMRTGGGRASVQLLELGGRGAREPLATLGLLLVTRGQLEARATDEEDPFELSSGDFLFVESARDGDEITLEGRDQTQAVLVHIDP